VPRIRGGGYNLGSRIGGRRERDRRLTGEQDASQHGQDFCEFHDFTSLVLSRIDRLLFKRGQIRFEFLERSQPNL
jgi:hypothetical protein